MLYTKPKDMRYVDLCKYFDNNFWLEDESFDEEKCYKYLYSIVYMIALKKKLLKLYSQYDSFVMYATNKIYLKALKNKRNKAPRIKNILDYTKSCLHFLKILWQKEEYSHQLNSAINDKIDIEAIKNTLRDNISNQYNQNLPTAIIACFKDIPNIIKEYTYELPYKDDKVLINNIELSVILSLYKGFKINDKALKNLKNCSNTETDIFDATKQYNLTLFRLNDNMKDLIILLCNKIRKKIAEAISKEISENTLDITTIDDILGTAWEATNHSKNNSTNDWEDD